MARRRSAMFRTLRGNIAHVVAQGTTAQSLDRMAERAIYHLCCTYLDMFRVKVEDFQRGSALVRVDAAEWARAKKVLQNPRGTVMVGPHVSNFDVVARWIAAQGIEMQFLGLAAPNAGTRVVNWLRRRSGITFTSISVASLRQALARLKRGGVVVTGVDRPVSAEDEPVPFFGAPARLPVGHVRLAMQAGSPVLVACAVQEPDGHYGLRFSPPIEMQVSGKRAEDLRQNTQRVLAEIEKMISAVPDQWLMLVPVWPDDL
jgi:phosphatidylinositol dimannoside acyltransferase